jgi:hypothetical protein
MKISEFLDMMKDDPTDYDICVLTAIPDGFLIESANVVDIGNDYIMFKCEHPASIKPYAKDLLN